MLPIAESTWEGIIDVYPIRGSVERPNEGDKELGSGGGGGYVRRLGFPSVYLFLVGRLVGWWIDWWGMDVLVDWSGWHHTGLGWASE